jgi:hypothetical protein
MSPAAHDLRATSAPTRVSELLLPTVLSLLTRAPASAARFSTLLRPQPEPRACPLPGMRVMESPSEPPAIHQPALPAEQGES